MANSKLAEDTIFEPDEVHRIQRARLAYLLHKLPHEIDAAPYLDVMDVINVYREDHATGKE